MSAQLDAIDNFAHYVRAVGAGSHVIVGPLTYPEFVVAVTARNPGSEFPFLSLSWPFDRTWAGADRQRAQDFLAALLRRDFETVEPCGNPLDFARAIEGSWPCAAAAIAARERAEAEVLKLAGLVGAGPIEG